MDSDASPLPLPMRQRLPPDQHDRRRPHRSGRRRHLAAARLNRAYPRDAPGRAQLVEIRRHVVLDPQRQDVPLPGAGRNREPFELLQHGKQSGFAFLPVVAPLHRHPLPAEQEAHELRGRHGLDLVALAVAGVAVDADQQAPLAPFFLAPAAEPAAHDRALGFEGEERGADVAGRQVEPDAQRRFRHRPDQLEAAAQDLRERERVAFLRALELGGPLDGEPEPVVEDHAPLVPQPRELRLPWLDLGRGQEAVHHERVVQLVVVPTSGQASAFTFSIAAGSRRPRSAASFGSSRRSVETERVRRPSASPSSRKA